jgi:hypothetical protein
LFVDFLIIKKIKREKSALTDADGEGGGLWISQGVAERRRVLRSKGDGDSYLLAVDNFGDKAVD